MVVLLAVKALIAINVAMVNDRYTAPDLYLHSGQFNCAIKLFAPLFL